MSLGPGRQLIKKYESDGNWSEWTSAEKELLVLTLYALYRALPGHKLECAFRLAEREKECDRLLTAVAAADIRTDRAWISGATFGWNCSQAKDPALLNLTIEVKRKDIAKATQALAAKAHA